MRILYIDCTYGVRPQKLFSALIDLFQNQKKIEKIIRKIGFIVKIIKKREKRRNFEVNLFTIKTLKYAGATPLKEILKRFRASSVKQNIIKKLIDTYTRIGKAESIIHGTSFSQVHLHEIGQPLSILYATGAIATIEKLGIKKTFVTELGVGSGKIKCSHGILPIPAPCTKLLIKNVKQCQKGVKGELTTPLGASLFLFLSSKSKQANFKGFLIKKIGLGWNSKPGPAIENPLILCEGKHV